MSDSGKVVVKSVEAQWIVAAFGVIPNYADSAPILDSRFHSVAEYAVANNVEFAGVPICLYHDNVIREVNIPIETIVPIAHEIEGNEQVWVYKLPEVKTMASIVHKGPFTTIPEAYATINEWIEKNQYEINGSLREVYIVNDNGGENAVTEIQYPVEKIKEKKCLFPKFCSFFKK